MKNLLLITSMLLSLNGFANDCDERGMELDYSGKFCVAHIERDIEAEIDDCEDEVRIQHEDSVNPHELVKMMFECRDELGQR